MIQDVFGIEYEEKCECEDCGETERLQFGICCLCGGNVIEIEDED